MKEAARHALLLLLAQTTAVPVHPKAAQLAQPVKAAEMHAAVASNASGAATAKLATPVATSLYAHYRNFDDNLHKIHDVLDNIRDKRADKKKEAKKRFKTFEDKLYKSAEWKRQHNKKEAEEEKEEKERRRREA